MTLSNTLFNNLTNKLKLETSLLQKEKFYAKNLLNQVTYLKKFKKNNSKDLSVREFFISNDKAAQYKYDPRKNAGATTF